MPTRKPSQKPKTILTPKYSGDESRGFWKRINKLEGESHRFAYNLGVILQDTEHHVLQYLRGESNV